MTEEDIHRRGFADPAENGVSGLELTNIGDSADSDDGNELNPLVGGIASSSPSKNPLPIVDDGHGTGAPGSATTLQMVINIVISFVGAGLLGVPNAFSKSGWLLGGISLLTVSACNVYAMLCLPAVQATLMQRQAHPPRKADPNLIVPSPGAPLQSYGDIGLALLGPRGERLVHVCLGISQAGFATAYVIFIAANMYSIWKVPRLLVCAGCVPGLAALVQFRELKSLAPFSLLANTANFAALTAVLLQDYETYEDYHHPTQPEEEDLADHSFSAVLWGGWLYVIAITIYSMEGVGMILSLKHSSAKPQHFSWLLSITIGVISLFMVAFGVAGYAAFGKETEAPITLNLKTDRHPKSATFVKLALCLGLYLTFPIMMFPIWSIVEGWSTAVRESAPTRMMVRTAVVVGSATVAYLIPHFGKFLSLVGSSICTLLGFVLPCYFHVKVMGPELAVWQYRLDIGLLLGGSLFGILGTIQSLMAMMKGELEDEV